MTAQERGGAVVQKLSDTLQTDLVAGHLNVPPAAVRLANTTKLAGRVVRAVAGAGRDIPTAETTLFPKVRL